MIKTRFFSILIIIYVFSLAIATYIEKIYSTDTAQAVIYHSKWFEFIMLLLIINIILNIKKYKLFKKWPILILHISFIFIFLGGVISRYIGYNGILSIREGEKSNYLISNKKYLQIYISDNNKCIFYKKNYIISYLHNNYKGFFYFKKNKILLKLTNYFRNVKEIFIPDNLGKKYINIITVYKDRSKNNYLKSGKIKNIGGYYFSFNKHVKGVINIFELKDKLFIETPLNIEILNKNHNNLKNKLISELEISSLYQIDKIKFFLNKKPFLGKIEYFPITINTNSNSLEYPSSITAILYKNNKIKKFNFLINKKSTLIKKNINFLGKNISIGYGPIILYLPFYVKLIKFLLDKYPGSSQPSSFRSKLQILDKKIIKNYNIYMNSIINYKGYRFFQSGYNSDEKGTILYVSHDFWGYNISYLGYLILIIGMFFTSFCKGTRFFKLKSKLKNNLF
ncbi:cytochrome c biogenesis protein [Candidatus Karelsulcia muelleri]|nr:cytochrome c biogenesis protein [Candidatus Karelsulcia muelleri]